MARLWAINARVCSTLAFMYMKKVSLSSCPREKVDTLWHWALLEHSLNESYSCKPGFHMIAEYCSGLQMITGLDIENLSFPRKHSKINWTKANYTTYSVVQDSMESRFQTASPLERICLDVLCSFILTFTVNTIAEQGFCYSSKVSFRLHISDSLQGISCVG